MPFSKESIESSELYRLILDNTLDAFIAIDERSAILEWSLQAERMFGWTRSEVLGRMLTDTVIPERYREAHLAGMARFLATGEGRLLGTRVELPARRKDGSELPVELAVTPIRGATGLFFSASLRDISERKALEGELLRQAGITRSILDSMPDAVVVADRSGRTMMMNPAARRLLNLPQDEAATIGSFREYRIFREDGRTPYPDAERPMTRALRGEQVDGAIGLICHGNCPQGVWVSANARPLLDGEGMLIGGVAVYHDITQLRQREDILGQQADLLHEQARLLELTDDAILVRDAGDRITYLNRSACRLYGFSRDEMLGRRSHELLHTRFPAPLEEIMRSFDQQRHWSGQLVHTTRDGREIIVFSRWALDTQEGQPPHILEINTDITQRVQTERALQQTQENYRLLVEGSTDFAIITTDPTGIVQTWNAGAEKILGIVVEEAVGQPISGIFTPEDRESGQPTNELERARQFGRAEDIRWHLRRDGSRFWANGVAMPLWNEDGSLRGFVKIMHDQTERRLAEEQNQFFANHDMLTGLPNRVHFSNRLHKAILVSQRSKVPLSILLLDLDRFKRVNDTLGHHAGDALLKEVAQRILSTIRETDFVARLGGDEFVIIQADTALPKAAETLARKLIAKLGERYQIDGEEVNTGTSVGISVYPKDGSNAVELLKKADLALYRAKSAGRGTFTFYAPTLSLERERQKEREDALRLALANGELELYYQPQVDLDSWKISTVEALLRWKIGEVEMALPGDFLDFAEESGLIVEIGEWALREACTQVRKWQEKGMSALRISVNCSARQFSDPQFVQRIGPILEETGLAANSLELEVKESMLSTQPGVKTQLTELRALGVRITIDNYGTGSNALVDLKEFEVDSLKIDRAFVQHLPHRRRDSAIASAIIGLAHDLGINVSAGGVETAEQLAYLKARDCTSAQGYIFSPPTTAEKLEELMLSDHWSRINRAPSLDNGTVFGDLH